jgi:hypothetical protein
MLEVEGAPVTPAAKLAAAWRNQNLPAERNLGEYLGAYGRLVYLQPEDDEQMMYLVDEQRYVAFVADGASWAKSIGDHRGRREINSAA